MRKNPKRFISYLYKYRKLQTIVLLLGGIALPLSLANPYLTKLVIDRAYVNKDMKLFLILAAIGGGIFVLSSLLNCLMSYLNQRIQRSVHFDMSKDAFSHLQNLPLSFYNNKSTGEHVYKLSSDVGVVSDFICSAIPEILMLLPRMLFILVIIFYLNWKLAFLAFLLLPVSMVHPYFFSKWLKGITQEIVESSQGVLQRLHEVFTHIHLVKALGKEDYEIKRFKRAASKRLNIEFAYARATSISSYSGSIVNKLLAGAIALYGGYLVMRGSVSLGALSAIMIYLTQLTGCVRRSSQLYERYNINSIARTRLNEILDVLPQVPDEKDAVDQQILKGTLELKNVSFGYNKDTLVLKNVSFSIPAHSKVALVGASGCGKTTILSLILRLHELHEGAILIDQINIRRIRLRTLKEQIGIALQDSFLWNDTVAFNILYGAEGLSEKDMIWAAKIAQADAFIQELPDRYESVVGEMACKISEGQKQRLAIARALIKKPKIVILDEAMASVDSRTEDKIIDAIFREFSDSTVLVVSHRLSTIEKMDLVCFMQSPCKAEIATHEELCAYNKDYRGLLSSQIEKKEPQVVS